MKNIAVIPARGGSKRIPRKNIKPFCGKPMIAWSIEAAIQSGCFDQVIVSTDDVEIAAVAKEYGAVVPFVRPAELANDYAGTIPVIQHAAQWIQEQWESVANICCLYATAPFVSSDDLRAGQQELRDTGADYVFAVTSYAFPIQRAIRLTHTGQIEMFYPEHYQTRSQDLEEAFHDAGQFYWGTVEAWCAGRPVFGQNTVPVVLPRYRVQDIDTPEDWDRAEWMFKALVEQQGKQQ
ncbi:pseudaminic acid cytidylyltransferase [Alcaligenaceae bacterium 429]|nr:pseudaminic acid cytidylyltransferase [Alcaligenaceae bacterium 429]